MKQFALWKVSLCIPFVILLIILLPYPGKSTFGYSLNSGAPNHYGRFSETQNTPLDSVVTFLLDASAKDFHDHQRPAPLGFRNVQLKHIVAPGTEELYLICGEFLTRDKENKEVWAPFSTVKTSGYEQWLGNQSLSFCKDSKAVSYKTKDLSSALKSRLDSLH